MYAIPSMCELSKINTVQVLLRSSVVYRGRYRAACAADCHRYNRGANNDVPSLGNTSILPQMHGFSHDSNFALEIYYLYVLLSAPLSVSIESLIIQNVTSTSIFNYVFSSCCSYLKLGIHCRTGAYHSVADV